MQLISAPDRVTSPKNDGDLPAHILNIAADCEMHTHDFAMGDRIGLHRAPHDVRMTRRT